MRGRRRGRAGLAHRFVVRLYPPRFRRQFGDQILQFTRDEEADGHGASLPSLVGAGVLAWGREVGRLGRRLASSGSGALGPRTGWRQDVSFALRAVRRQPRFSVVVMLTLALTIGALATTLAVIESVVLRPLPYPEAGRLVMVWDEFRGVNDDEIELAADQYQEYRGQAIFDSVAAYRLGRWNLSGASATESVSGAAVTASVFAVLAREPAVGRSFTPDEDRPGGPAAVVISHGLWTRRFGADADVIGRTAVLDDRPFTIVGVMAPGFAFPRPDLDVWLPLQLGDTNRSLARGYEIVARLAPGVSSADVGHWAERMTGVAADRFGIPEQFRPLYRTRVVSLHDQVVGDVRPALWGFLAAVALLLSVAAANLAGLVLVRNESRRREFAVRASLGAARSRLVRQVLVETVVLAVAGGAVGLLLAALVLDALPLLGSTIPRAASIGLSWGSAGATVVASVLVGTAFGVVPAAQVARVNLRGELAEGRGSTAGSERQVYRSLLVAGEVALATVLLVGAGLLLRSFGKLVGVEPGFRAEGVIVADLDLPTTRLPTDSDVVRVVDDVLREAEVASAIESAAIVSDAPLRSAGTRDSIIVEDRIQPIGEPPVHVRLQFVSPGYFSTMGLTLRAGRSFTGQDAEGGQPVAMLTEGIAQRLWPDGPALGRRVALAGPEPRRWVTIIGVVGDVRASGLDVPPTDDLFVPYRQAALVGRSLHRRLTLAVRSASEGSDVVEAIREAVAAADRGTAPADLVSMDVILSRSLARPRLATGLVAAFAIGALVLAALGIYGVVAHAVASRTREIGIRVALGARRGAVLHAVTARTLAVGALGLALGLACAGLAAASFSAFLYEVETLDLASFIGAAGVLGISTIVAAVAPALRASRVDAVVALRSSE